MVSEVEPFAFVGRFLNPCYTECMNKVLEQGIEAARALSEEQQSVAGELLMTLAMRPELSSEQIEEVKLAQAEAARGEFATDEQTAALWKRSGV